MITRDVRKLLPIGSVVKMKGAEKRLMIFGIRQTDASTQVEHDYAGVLYPEGNLGEEMRFLFDHDDIDQIVFVGYSDDERAEFLENLNRYLNDKG